MLTARSLCLLRGWTAAAVATTAAALAHTVAGGPWPSPMLLLLCLALSAPVCMLLARLRIPLLGLAGSVILSQALFHHLFAASGSLTAVVDRTSHVGHHALSSARATGPQLVLAPSAGVSGHDHAVAVESASGAMQAGAGWLMPALHVVAALVTIAVLQSGESLARRAAATLLVGVRGLLSLLDRPMLPAIPRWSQRPVSQTGPRPGLLAVLTGLRYRGPPLRLGLV